MMPEMHPVQSSNVRSVGYDEEKAELWIAFNGGRTYVYTGVPNGVLDDILAAPSVGKFVNEQIKNVYTGRQV